VFAIPSVTFEKAVADVLGVRIFAVFGDDCGYFGLSGHDIIDGFGWLGFVEFRGSPYFSAALRDPAVTLKIIPPITKGNPFNTCLPSIV